MYILDNPLRTVEIVLGGAVSSAEAHWTAHYKNFSKSGDTTRSSKIGVTTGSTAVTMVDVPKAGERHGVHSITVHNADNASITVTIRFNDNGTFRTIFKCTLATLENLVYESDKGWTAYTTAGARK